MTKLNPIRKQIASKLGEIGDSIRENLAPVQKVGVFEGLSGIALFQFTYGQFAKNPQMLELGVECINRAIDMVNDGFETTNYCSGIAGLGWTLDYLSQEKYIETNVDETLSDLDQTFAQIMRRDLSNGYFDFLHGAMGYGYYFLQRYECTKSNDLKKRYRKYILDLVDGLEGLSERVDESAIRWTSPHDQATGAKVYNFGVAHGIPSILNFLSRLVPVAEFRKKSMHLLNGGTEYLIRCQSKARTTDFFFPSWETLEGTYNNQSRLAWCYGDLGIAITLSIIARALRRQDLHTLSMDLLRHCAQRRGFPETSVVDATLCHGAAGNSHMFRNAYNLTKDSTLLSASQYWLEVSLNMSSYSDGFAGYKHFRGPNNLTRSLDLLMGISGIGLAMVSHFSKKKPSWDKCMMLS